MLENIDRFGVMAILGRPTLYAGEIYRMRTAEAVYKGYMARKNSESWFAFAKNYPGVNSILMEIEKEING